MGEAKAAVIDAPLQRVIGKPFAPKPKPEVDFSAEDAKGTEER